MSIYVIKPSGEFPLAWDIEQADGDFVPDGLILGSMLVVGSDEQLEHLFWELAGFILENIPKKRQLWTPGMRTATELTANRPWPTTAG